MSENMIQVNEAYVDRIERERAKLRADIELLTNYATRADQKIDDLGREVGLHRKRAHDLQEKLNIGMANYATMKDEGMRLSVVLATLLKSYLAQADILMRSSLLNSEQQDQLYISVQKFKMAVGVKEMPTDVSEA